MMIKQEITQYYEIEKRQIYELLRDELLDFKAEEYNEPKWGKDVYMPYKHIDIRSITAAGNSVRTDWESDLEAALFVLIWVGAIPEGNYLVHYRENHE